MTIYICLEMYTAILVHKLLEMKCQQLRTLRLEWVWPDGPPQTPLGHLMVSGTTGKAPLDISVLISAGYCRLSESLEIM